jgi:hypothetical protein
VIQLLIRTIYNCYHVITDARKWAVGQVNCIISLLDCSGILWIQLTRISILDVFEHLIKRMRSEMEGNENVM